MKNALPVSVLTIAIAGWAILNWNIFQKTKNGASATISPSRKYRIADAGVNSCINYCKLFLKGWDNSTLSLSLRVQELEIQLSRFKVLVPDFKERNDLSSIIAIIEEIEKRNPNVDTSSIRELLK